MYWQVHDGWRALLHIYAKLPHRPHTYITLQHTLFTMAAAKDDEKQYYIPKKLLGELIRILITSTDPANILGFTSAAINSSRALMIRMLEVQVPNPDIINNTLNTLLTRTIAAWNTNQSITQEEAQELDKMLMSVFKSEPMMKYDLEMYRDILYCETLFENWKSANKTYISDKSAWAESNAIIADIHKHLYEIIFRHNLMQLPYGDSFNLDTHGTDTSQIQMVLRKMAEAAAGDENR
jgi:hypothetical protein